jgi:phosphinothricin acetyltransferase
MIFRDYKDKDINDLLTIFNLYAKDSFAVYCDFELNISQFEILLEQVKIILVMQEGKTTIGFGFISNYKPFHNFNHTGVLTYFIRPEYTGKGYGTKLLNNLISLGKEAGITNYLAHISSRNQPSLNFHKNHGFKIVGRFKNVAVKFGKPFDIVWVQKQYNE